ncbi:MAG: U32 family peptidase [Sphaerochaeta sp.]
MVELTTPAGSLQSALAAFNEGSDGVYLGLKSFSARKGATNFTLEELAKLRNIALKENKRIYLTINTLIEEAYLQEVVVLLKEIERIGCDGVIVQDLGVARIIRTHFPSLALHGSTQLAVHTARGVRQLQKWGFERIVLSRELTVEEIHAIRRACPDVELKVFVHGALCYAFSGLCMASHYLTGRSANQGSCAQICRNWWSVEEDPEVPDLLSPLGEGKRNGPFFSMSDLNSLEVVEQLDAMGIDSVKIEGRMKSPAYSAFAAQAYRSALDGRRVDEDPLSITFARSQTGGWLSSYGRTKADFSVRHTPSLGSGSYAGHRGVIGGTILDYYNDELYVELIRPIADRDGLMYLVENHHGVLEPVRFGVRKVGFAQRGQRIWLQLPGGSKEPIIGEPLYIISGHNLNLPLISEEIAPYQQSIDLTIVLEDNQLTIQSPFGSAVAPLSLERAHQRQDLLSNLTTIFSQSDQSLFTLGNLYVENKSSFEDEEIFLPLSVLKKIRRAFYQSLDGRFKQLVQEPFNIERLPKKESITLPRRSLLVDDQKIPYLDPPTVLKKLTGGSALPDLLFRDGSYLYFPLSPITFLEEEFFDALTQLIDHARREGLLDQIRFGVNNVSHIAFFEEHQLPVFIDIYLYLANSQSAALLSETSLNLIGGYYWLERLEGDFTTWVFEPTVVDEAFIAPLFISRSCFRYDSLGLSCENCPRKGSWYVTQSDKRLKVNVRDCITTLMIEELF